MKGKHMREMTDKEIASCLFDEVLRLRKGVKAYGNEYDLSRAFKAGWIMSETAGAEDTPEDAFRYWIYPDE